MQYRSVSFPARRVWSALSNTAKTLFQVLRGTSDNAVRFSDLTNLLQRLGFQRRIRGDHHIFTREGVLEILNLQPRGGYAKPYQVKQVRRLILLYRLAGEIHDDR